VEDLAGVMQDGARADELGVEVEVHDRERREQRVGGLADEPGVHEEARCGAEVDEEGEGGFGVHGLGLEYVELFQWVAREACAGVAEVCLSVNRSSAARARGRSARGRGARR